MTQALSKIIGRMERVLTAITAAMMAILSVVVCWQVFARYVLQKSPYWVEEFSVTAIMWVGLLGAAGAVWTGDHMRLEILMQKLPERFGLVVELLVDAAIGYFAFFLFTQGIVLTEATWTSRMSTIPLPLGLTYLVLPVAAAFMVLFACFRILEKAIGVARSGRASGGKRDAR